MQKKKKYGTIWSKTEKNSIYETVENPAEAELQTNCDGDLEHLWGQMIND